MSDGQAFLFDKRAHVKSLIPLSHLEGTAAQAFGTVLDFHLDGERVLDLTYGTGLSWKGLQEPTFLVKSDLIEPYCQDMFTAEHDRPYWLDWFDLVYFDPPYFSGVEDSDDPRESAYGEYNTDLDRYMGFVPEIAKFLRPGGKIILKCQDQFEMATRKFEPHHLRWCASMEKAFEIGDFFVYRYHRMNPRSFQVKNRPCSVIMHTYFIVGQKP